MGLAGPKTKQRIGADPNNLHWSNDTGKFGHKMLTKMGWAPGKGLGANEDGNTEHVKVRLKDNNFGIGANKKNMDNWLDNTDAFSRLLADLNERVGSEQSSPAPESPLSKEDQSEESNSDSSEKKSKKKSKKEKKDKKDKKSKKEKKSKKSKKEESSDEEDDTVVVAATTTTFRNAARAKFLRAKRLANGKDVESMSQILGIKSNSASTAGSPVSSPNVTEEKIEISTMENVTAVPMVVNKMNVQDYFAIKMKSVRASGIASSGLKTATDFEEEEEEQTRPSFGGLGFSATDDSSPSLGFGLASRNNGLVTGNGLGFIKSTTTEMTVEVREEPEVKDLKKESKKRKKEEAEEDKTDKRKSKKEKKLKSSDEDKKESKKEKKEKKEKKSKKDSKKK